MIELKLLDGTNIVRSFELNRIYNLVEHTRLKWCFRRKFPFFGFEREKYITFRYQDVYETMRDHCDSKISALVTLPEFMMAMGVEFTSYEEIKIRSAVRGI